MTRRLPICSACFVAWANGADKRDGRGLEDGGLSHAVTALDPPRSLCRAARDSDEDRSER